MPNIIGITGYAQHGKGTVADMLKHKYGYEVVSFADPVRALALAINPIIRPGLHTLRLSDVIHVMGWHGAKTQYPEVRRVLQKIGTEAIKPVFGDDCWARIACHKVLTLMNHGVSRICFDDLRFPIEEGEMLYNLARQYPNTVSVEVWRVNRVDKSGQPYNNGIGTDHPSESQIHNFVPDLELTNVSGKPQLLTRQIQDEMDSRKPNGRSNECTTIEQQKYA